MKTYLDCYPCFLRQALEAARMAGADEQGQKEIVSQVLEQLKHIAPSQTPPEIGAEVHRIVRQRGNHRDPYRIAKEQSTKEALSLLPKMQALLAEAEDPLDMAVRLSIAGNIIDFGPAHKYVLWDVVEQVLAKPFAVDDMPAFQSALRGADRVLYLADNAGETVFDRLLIQVLDRPVIYAVKGGPILNDATEHDARAAGVDTMAQIVSTGSDAPGTILDRCSPAFRKLYEDAPLVIAKGQANYETLSEQGEKTFFLLQTKCPVIARDVDVPVASIVLKQGTNKTVERR